MNRIKICGSELAIFSLAEQRAEQGSESVEDNWDLHFYKKHVEHTVHLLHLAANPR